MWVFFYFSRQPHSFYDNEVGRMKSEATNKLGGIRIELFQTSGDSLMSSYCVQ